MQVFLYSFNAVSPMFIAVFAGAFIKKRGIMGDSEIKFLNTLCFRYLLSTHIFNSVLSVDFSIEFNPRLVLTFIICITALFISAWIIFTLLIKDAAQRCIYIVTSYRSNNIIYALPLAANLFGEAGIKAAAALVPFTIIFFNFFTVIAMVYHKQKTGNEENGQLKAALKKCVREIASNPLIIGSALGIIAAISRVKLPLFLERGVSSIAAAATPLSLILLGAQINLKELKGNIRASLAASLVRLVLVPLALIPLAAFLGFRGPELSALVIAFSAPSAVSNLIMARNYGVAPSFAAQTVYLSTLASMVTIFFIVSLMRGLALF